MQLCKRPSRPEKDRLPPKNKRRKKEDEEIRLCSSSSEPLFTHLTQVTHLISRCQCCQCLRVVIDWLLCP